jgi:hypothetical protein
MTASEILARAVGLYRRGFAVLLLVTAVVNVPLAVINALIGSRVANVLTPFADYLAGTTEPTPAEVERFISDALPAIVSAGVTFAIVSWLAGALLTPALILASSEVDAGGRPQVGDIYRRAFGSFLAILVGGFVVGLVVGAVFLGIIVLGVLILILAGDQAIGLGILATVVAFIVALVVAGYISVRWAVWPAAVVLEGKGPLEALGRAWRLAKGSLWRIAGVTFVTAIAAGIAGLVLGIVGGAIGAALPAGWEGFPTELLMILVASWYAIAITLLFLDLRVRSEGAPAALPGG